MDERDIIQLIDERLELALPKADTKPVRLMPIRPFRAYDHAGKEMEVVGITHDGDDDLNFVVIKTGEDGDEIWPSIEGSAFRTPELPSEKGRCG